MQLLRCEIFPADLDATVYFYVEMLGFCLVRDERTASAYVALERGRVRLGAAARPEVADRELRRPPGVELVLEVDDVDAERRRAAAANGPVTQDLMIRPWGLRDFRLLDPNGYYWRITSSSSHVASQEPWPVNRASSGSAGTTCRMTA